MNQKNVTMFIQKIAGALQDGIKGAESADGSKDGSTVDVSDMLFALAYTLDATALKLRVNFDAVDAISTKARFAALLQHASEGQTQLAADTKPANVADKDRN